MSGPNNGIVLGQYQSRVLDMASAYATLAASGRLPRTALRAEGRHRRRHGAARSRRAAPASSGLERGRRRQRHRGDAADRGVLAQPQPGRRPSVRGEDRYRQLGDTGENKDAWMVGYTPSLSTAVWVGTEQGLPLHELRRRH